MTGARPAFRVALLLAIVTAGVLAAGALGLRDPGAVEALAARARALRGLPGAAPLFVLVYVVATAAGLPGTALTLAGGAIFGFASGTLLNWAGATLGAVAAYALARSLGRDTARRLLGRHADSVDRMTSRHGFRALLRLRLIPVVPFNALNFASGLAAVEFRSYLVATALGILPETAIVTWLADALLAGAIGARRQALLRGLAVGLLLLTLSLVPALRRRLGWTNPA